MKFLNHKKTTANFSRKTGFTLIEMLVAVFVFSVVMMLATGAIFSIVSAYKTSQALKIVMDNLSSALDSMSRDIRYGTNYHCGGGTLSDPQSCPEGDSDDETFAFFDKNGDQIVYVFKPASVIDREEAIFKCSGTTIDDDNCIRLTAPEVHITKLHFYVQGAEKRLDVKQQPMLLITISGYAKVGSNQAEFNIETMVSQRNLVCEKLYSSSICNP